MAGVSSQESLRGRVPEPALRLVGGAALLVVLTAVLWQAGFLFSAGAEEVLLRDAEGEQRLVQVRAADTSVGTPSAPVPSGRQLSIGPAVGQLAPNFEASNFEGSRVQLADFRGQPILLNFWASWCTPCIAEMPDMQTLLEAFADTGLVVFAVNAGERFEPAYYFVQGLGVSFTEFGMDPGEDVSRLYRVRGMPTSVFITRDGVISRVHLGQMTIEQMKAYVLEAIASTDMDPSAHGAQAR
jgi:thiol-disulfide isomerase/thioredoxin